jgi:hypothetical protein
MNYVDFKINIGKGIEEKKQRKTIQKKKLMY